jgi:hypothetical protein
MLQIPTCIENLLLMIPGIYIHVLVKILVISRGLGFRGGSLTIALPGRKQDETGICFRQNNGNTTSTKPNPW